MDIVGGEEGLQGLKLEHPESREVARGEIEVGAGEGSPGHPREVFGVEIEKNDPTVEAGVEGELGDVKARREPPVDKSNNPSPPSVEIVVKDEVGLPEFGEESRIIVSGGMGLLEADDVRRFAEGGEVPGDPLEAGMLLALVGVEGEGPDVVEDDPGVGDRGVEGAGGTVYRLRTHLLWVSTRSKSSWRLAKGNQQILGGAPGSSHQGETGRLQGLIIRDDIDEGDRLARTQIRAE